MRTNKTETMEIAFDIFKRTYTEENIKKYNRTEFVNYCIENYLTNKKYDTETNFVIINYIDSMLFLNLNVNNNELEIGHKFFLNQINDKWNKWTKSIYSPYEYSYYKFVEPNKKKGLIKAMTEVMDVINNLGNKEEESIYEKQMIKESM